jgi:hypothetical protein
MRGSSVGWLVGRATRGGGRVSAEGGHTSVVPVNTESSDVTDAFVGGAGGICVGKCVDRCVMVLVCASSRGYEEVSCLPCHVISKDIHLINVNPPPPTVS